MLEWLAMGGYWAYVWPAYGVAFAGLAAILVPAWRAHRRAQRAADDKSQP